MKFLVFFIMMIASPSFWGQSQSDDKVPKEGTFQIVVHGTKEKLVFSNEQLKGMENKRLDNQNVTFQISENAYIFLPSHRELDADGFQNLKPIIYQ